MSFYLGDKPATLFLKMRHRRAEVEERAEEARRIAKLEALKAKLIQQMQAAGVTVVDTDQAETIVSNIEKGLH
jgi:TRAP-type C4-dicarboxylate transport system substrate-binding protein